MTGQELANNAREFLNVTTCYLLGFWGQYCSQAEYNRVNAELKNHGKNNDKYNNQKYINTNVYAADCVCFVKGLLGGLKVGHRVSYSQMAAPIGDVTPEDFANKLYDRVSPGMNVPAGYGLAKPGHAALSLGNGEWIDFSFNNYQNGAKLHSGGVPAEYTCGKIPTIDYSAQPTPEPSGDAASFRDYLISHSSKIISDAYDAWKGGK